LSSCPDSSALNELAVPCADDSAALDLAALGEGTLSTEGAHRLTAHLCGCGDCIQVLVLTAAEPGGEDDEYTHNSALGLQAQSKLALALALYVGGFLRRSAWQRTIARRALA
jgi:hypothetical protein